MINDIEDQNKIGMCNRFLQQFQQQLNRRCRRLQGVDQTGFTVNQCWAMEQDGVPDLIFDEIITRQQFILLRNEQCVFLVSSDGRDFIIKSHISIEQFIGLSETQCIALETEQVRKLIINKHMTIQELSRLSKGQAEILYHNDDICDLIRDRYITIEDFLKLNALQCRQILDGALLTEDSELDMNKVNLIFRKPQQSTVTSSNNMDRPMVRSLCQ